ncbi:hypothetical protein A2773_01945 [Candidatus Gottesmanbacteria bacterium RIFCSPHIGHO2_01_FULL_39_10]|uniref:Transcriptional repressor n=1 Tax=Candidatus Gottesmanbacteria bacterium RIFCSPHIGHO2_01_FULL_39_10 TaxID=1798375 RepID=A0A1F5ZKD3_9BACT|nr:MAG: hypothetical protein A2773_01945 [Candidatus Gottesmanbacteria bacterium RIFCSPHIGHO2_01_FULL_39_10]
MNSKEILKANKIRPTKARVFLLNLLANAEKPLDATSLLSLIRKRRLGIDRSTLFRTIQIFLKKELIRKLEFGDGKYHYEVSALPHHHHLVCNNCGQIKDVVMNDVQILEKEIEKKAQFHINHHHLEFFGLCRNCH